MRRSYPIYICPSCDEPNQFAGFCDTCNVRLALVPCAPISGIIEFIESRSEQDGPLSSEELASWLSPSRSGSKAA